MSVFVGNFQKMPPGVLPEAFGGLNRETVMFQTAAATFDGASGLVVGEPHSTKRHAVVEAASPCSLPAFQDLLGATLSAWSATQARRRST